MVEFVETHTRWSSLSRPQPQGVSTTSTAGAAIDEPVVDPPRLAARPTKRKRMRTPCSALVLALVLLAGCSPSAPPSPSPRPTTAITAQVLGQILDEHDRGA